MKNYEDIEILKGIRQNDNSVLLYIYKTYYSNIHFFITKDGGSDDDSADIFQEAIITIYRKLKGEKDFKLDCSFETYLYSVCKFCWLKILDQKKHKQENTYNNLYNNELENVSTLLRLRKYDIYEKYFNQLTEEEQKLLQLYFDKTDKDSILKIMGYSNTKWFKNKLQKTKNSLIKLIKEDSEYQKIIDNAVEDYIK